MYGAHEVIWVIDSEALFLKLLVSVLVLVGDGYISHLQAFSYRVHFVLFHCFSIHFYVAASSFGVITRMSLFLLPCRSMDLRLGFLNVLRISKRFHVNGKCIMSLS